MLLGGGLYPPDNVTRNRAEAINHFGHAQANRVIHTDWLLTTACEDTGFRVVFPEVA